MTIKGAILADAWTGSFSKARGVDIRRWGDGEIQTAEQACFLGTTVTSVRVHVNQVPVSV